VQFAELGIRAVFNMRTAAELQSALWLYGWSLSQEEHRRLGRGRRRCSVRRCGGEACGSVRRMSDSATANRAIGRSSSCAPPPRSSSWMQN
jgi:hypothetical protein